MIHLPSQVLDPAAMPLVALDSMNATHREELDLINELGTLLAAAGNGAPDLTAIDAKLEHWLAHTQEHFDRENRLMRKHGFPAYPMHRGEHDRVLLELEALQQDWRQHRDTEVLAVFLFRRWPDWFLSHVASMDRITAEFLAAASAAADSAPR
jgi:hemerythrin